MSVSEVGREKGLRATASLAIGIVLGFAATIGVTSLLGLFP